MEKILTRGSLSVFIQSSEAPPRKGRIRFKPGSNRAVLTTEAGETRRGRVVFRDEKGGNQPLDMSFVPQRKLSDIVTGKKPTPINIATFG